MGRSCFQIWPGLSPPTSLDSRMKPETLCPNHSSWKDFKFGDTRQVCQEVAEDIFENFDQNGDGSLDFQDAKASGVFHGSTKQAFGFGWPARKKPFFGGIHCYLLKEVRKGPEYGIKSAGCSEDTEGHPPDSDRSCWTLGSHVLESLV